LALLPRVSAFAAPVVPQDTVAPWIRQRPLCTSCVNTDCSCAKFTAWSLVVAADTPLIAPAFVMPPLLTLRLARLAAAPPPVTSVFAYVCAPAWAAVAAVLAALVAKVCAAVCALPAAVVAKVCAAVWALLATVV